MCGIDTVGTVINVKTSCRSGWGSEEFGLLTENVGEDGVGQT